MRTGSSKWPMVLPEPPAGVKFKVFVVGLTHTGKNSVDAALARFGYTCKHYPNPKRVIEESEQYDALSDTPVLLFVEALDRIYPDSKFILTVRDLDSWLQSCKEHWARKTGLSELQLWNRISVYGTIKYDEQLFRQAYATHHRRVQDYFRGRPEKLLVLNVCAGEGYEKLCPFLGVPLVEEPFPHRNRK